MFSQNQLFAVWFYWFIGGVCGVALLLIVIFYCCPMPRHHKCFDEQYLKEYSTKENQHKSQTNYRIKQVELEGVMRPASYAGQCHSNYYSQQTSDVCMSHFYGNQSGSIKEPSAQYASSSILDDAKESSTNIDALKTRSLPAFLRPKPRPLSTEDNLQQLYDKVNLSKKYKRRMRNEHAAIIALSKSNSECLDSDAVIVFEQRTAL